MNHRLRWCFSVCKNLGIDDPVTWMNNTSPAVLDAWIAYESFECDMAEKASKGSKAHVDMDSVSEHMNKIT